MGSVVSMPRSVRAAIVLAAGVLHALIPGAADAQVPTTSPTPRLGTAAGASNCTTECHGDIVGRKVMHKPAMGKCEECHVQIGAAKDHTFSYLVASEDLCRRCHVLPHERVMHAPVVEGKCMDCHDPHGSDHPRVLKADPQRDLCLLCHKDEFSSAKFVHGPVAVGACIVCHAPHSSSHQNLLIQDTRSMCLTCHPEVLAKTESGLHVHGAMEEGCTHCHDPHASEHKFQLHQEAPGLCLSCHQDRFDQITAGAVVVHGAITAAGGCTGCHEPHSSRLPSLQRSTEPGVCLACHDKALITSDGRELTNMARLLAENPNKHGPIREGACTACHDPHAGKHFRLLTEDYPPQFYAPFDIGTFSLCFKCHMSDLVFKADGRGLTNFRDGERNLHWLHVNQEKGRTCRACHEVHASKRPAHIREAVPFGTSGWMLEINFQQSIEGGSCSPGCHKPKTYNRGPATLINPIFRPDQSGAAK